MKAKRNLISAAAALAIAAASPAHAVLERLGPVDTSPRVGGYPAWFQDKSGIAVEFCSLETQAEWDGGWCVLIPPDGLFPENFPTSYFDEHFYYIADNGLSDPGNAFRARLVVALEAAFVNGAPAEGDQMVFQRVRVFIPNLPWAGDYRVITPYSDITYSDMKVGDRIFETQDTGVTCPGTFECSLTGPIGPFLLPSAAPGGVEVPPMPDLISAPVGTDPFFDAAIAGAAPTASPGTGKKYLADPVRIGPVTGSSLPNFVDSTGASRNHNTFRVEYTPLAGDLTNQPLAWDGETNFSIAGRLMTGTVPGRVTGRAVYKADSNGMSDIDVFARGAKTLPSRVPAQQVQPLTQPVINFYDKPCGGTPGVDQTGQPIIKPPFTSPGGVAHPMGVTGSDYWAQSAPGGLPPSQICIEDVTARNAAGQVVAAYYPVPVTDDVAIASATYDAANNGLLTVKAGSSDTTAVLTLAGYGNGPGSGSGTSAGPGAGAGLDLASGTATVTGLNAPPSTVQVSSNFGGSAILRVTTGHGATAAPSEGVPVALNDVYPPPTGGFLFEDCTHVLNQVGTAGCSKGPTVDLLANDTIVINGVSTTVRAYMATKPTPVVTVAITQPPRLGTAVVTSGRLTYTPSLNANGLDEVGYTVTVNGKTSNQALVRYTITPVNDIPVAGNTTSQAVANHPVVMNLLASATDADGNEDVKNAVVVAGTWPASFGTATLTNGVISFTPTTAGNFSFNYQVKDAKVLSTNQGTATVTVLAAESIAYTKQRFTGAGNVGGGASTRWVVTGTDTVNANQIMTIAYADGQLTAAQMASNASFQVNNGSCQLVLPTDPVPSFCVIGTAQVLANTWSFDQVGTPGGLKDPNDTSVWQTKPLNLVTRSTNPNLGGSANIGIEFR